MPPLNLRLFGQQARWGVAPFAAYVFLVFGSRGMASRTGAPTCPRFSRFMAKCALGVSVARSQSKSESDSDGDLFMWLAGCCCSLKRRGQLHEFPSAFRRLSARFSAAQNGCKVLQCREKKIPIHINNFNLFVTTCCHICK